MHFFMAFLLDLGGWCLATCIAQPAYQAGFKGSPVAKDENKFTDEKHCTLDGSILFPDA
jgi:hypothetical protein